MNISKQARHEAKELFRSCLVNGLLDENRVRETVTQVIARKPRSYFAILSHFHRLVKLDVERRTARIESETVLSPELQDNVRNRLNELYGPGLSVSFAQNPDLIGGMRVRVGSDVYDGSVRARLDALEEKF